MHTVWLIRHGESQSNIGDSTKYSRVSSLTELGHKQAEEILSAFLAFDKAPSLIITSKYDRSTQTALPTIKHFPDARWEQQRRVHEFTYLSINNCQHTTREERRPLAEKFWSNSDPMHKDGDGAESFEQFINRAYEVIEQLRFSKEDFIAMFTHGQFIQAILWLLDASPTRLDSSSKESFRRFCAEYPIPIGAIVSIKFDGRDKPLVDEMLISHLSEQNTNEPGKDTEDAPRELQKKILTTAAY